MEQNTGEYWGKNIPIDIFVHQALYIRLCTSGFGHQALGIRLWASGIVHPASCIRHRASGIVHPASASGIRHRESCQFLKFFERGAPAYSNG